MFINLFRIAFGERSYSTSSEQDTNNTPGANEKSIVEEKVIEPAIEKKKNVAVEKINAPTTLDELIETTEDPDLQILAEKYGDLVPGKVIEIELHEAAVLLNRQRVKVDAFSRLKNKLKSEYGVELIITSRRTKKGV